EEPLAHLEIPSPETLDRTMVALTPSFRAEFIAGYKTDAHLSGPYSQLQKLSKEEPLARKYECWEYADELLYFVDKKFSVRGARRLAVPKTMVERILQLAHDDHAHYGFKRTRVRLASFYWKHMS